MKLIFQISIFFVLIQSIIIFIDKIKNNKTSEASYWQFPMVLAIFLESIYVN